MSDDETYPIHKEDFEVVMIRDGKHEFTAMPEDYKRIFIEAENPLLAQMDDVIAKEKGWRPIAATKPGVLTAPEVGARQRASAGPFVDRSKL